MESSWDFPGGPVAKTPNAGGPGLIPGGGTRSHMLKLRPSSSQINKNKYILKNKRLSTPHTSAPSGPPVSYLKQAVDGR